MSRRSFLAAGAGLALAACGSKGDSGSGSATTPAEGDATGGTVLVRYFNDGVLAAGVGQRLPFGLGNKDGVVTKGGPDQLAFDILDSTGATVTQVTAARHDEGVPRPYWPVLLQLDQPGLYTAQVLLGDGRATSAFSITPAAQVAMPKPGDKMIPVLTPTVGDSRGVNPICTRQPACPLHDVTLTDALATGRPVAVLIGTPAYCQTGVCGPVLDVLLGQRDSHPGVVMVHAEIYKDPEQALSSSATTAATGTGNTASLGETTEAVEAYSLPFEPVLYLARSDGTIANRLDSIYDGAELEAALDGLA